MFIIHSSSPLVEEGRGGGEPRVRYRDCFREKIKHCVCVFSGVVVRENFYNTGFIPERYLLRIENT